MASPGEGLVHLEAETVCVMPGPKRSWCPPRFQGRKDTAPSVEMLLMLSLHPHVLGTLHMEVTLCFFSSVGNRILVLMNKKKNQVACAFKHTNVTHLPPPSDTKLMSPLKIRVP